MHNESFDGMLVISKEYEALYAQKKTNAGMKINVYLHFGSLCYLRILSANEI